MKYFITNKYHKTNNTKMNTEPELDLTYERIHLVFDRDGERHSVTIKNSDGEFINLDYNHLLVATSRHRNVYTYEHFYISPDQFEHLNSLSSFDKQKEFLQKILRSGDYLYQDFKHLITYCNLEHSILMPSSFQLSYAPPNDTGISIENFPLLSKPHTFYKC